MAPPGGRGRGRGSGRARGRGRGKGDGRGRSGRQGRGRRSSTTENDEHIYTDVDRFHAGQDKINFASEDSDSDKSDESDEEKAVMNLPGGQDGSSDEEDDDDEDSEDLDSEASDLPDLPEHVRRAAMDASSDDGDSDDAEDGKGKFAAGWGKSRSSYYNADTADLEIGQEFEDAEAEEEAALELQRASYKRLDPADYGEEETEDDRGEGAMIGKEKTRKGINKGGGTSAQVATLSAMKSDLEQIALGGAGEVETSHVKRDTSKLTRRDKLELVLSEAPELPSLMGEVRAHLNTLTESVQPLVSNVTADIGASKDGLLYLRTRQQLLLAYAMNVCFYMRLKAKGEPAKGHPVVRRLLSLRALVADMSVLDEKMSSQCDLLVRALASGIDLAGAGNDSDGDDSDDDEGDEGLVAASNGIGAVRGGSMKADDDASVDESGLKEEEARFMGIDSDGYGSSSSGGDEEQLSAVARKKRKLAKRKKDLAGTRARIAAGDGAGDASLGDFGDEDVDEEARAAMTGSGGGNILQGMVNRISQRATASGKRGRGLEGDLDVPIRERDQTIRVRRPAPGESGDDSENGRSEGSDGSDIDDLGMGDDGFLGGLPSGLLEGLSRRTGGGDRAGGGAKKKKNRDKEEKRARHDGNGDGGVGEEDDGFYAAVAEEKERKKRAKLEKYNPQARIAGALEAELEAERTARGETKRGASYTIIKNRGLTPHKNKLNRNPRSKKREAFRKATIRRKGQVRDVRTGEADSYGGEFTGIKSNVTRSRKLKG